MSKGPSRLPNFRMNVVFVIDELEKHEIMKNMNLTTRHSQDSSFLVAMEA